MKRTHFMEGVLYTHVKVKDIPFLIQRVGYDVGPARLLLFWKGFPQGFGGCPVGLLTCFQKNFCGSGL